MEILFATKNPAKIAYYKTELEKHGMEIYTLREKHVDCEVDETGKTAIENAILKAKAYYEQTHLKTIAIVSGGFKEGGVVFQTVFPSTVCNAQGNNLTTLSCASQQN